MGGNIGSIWHKWDFHVHTPYSILNNQYGINPFEAEDEDQFVQRLFTKAIEHDIMAIGITDYFMIDGYKRLVEGYIKSPEKMLTLFPEETVRNKIAQIYIFPNIELRLDTFVSASSVNYHVIFLIHFLFRRLNRTFYINSRFIVMPELLLKIT